MVDIDDLKANFLNSEFDRKDFVLSRENLVIAATTSGESRPQYIDPEHPDFQAAPAFLCSLASGKHLPIDFPALGGVPMDGGKAVECFAPVRPDTTLTGRTHLHDIYDKKGRSGRMIFIVVRMELYNDANEHLVTTDSRLVIREK
jgi:acyl dehydratase